MAFPWTGRIRINGAALRSRAYKNPHRPHEGILADLPLGTCVTVTAKEGGWLYVTATFHGRMLNGYVSQELVERASSNASAMYYQLVPQGNAITVISLSGDEIHGPLSVLSEEQFQDTLRRNSVPTVTTSAVAGYTSSLQFLPGFESHASGSFSLEPGTLPLHQSKWRGTLGEISAQHGGLLPQRNLNSTQTNFPIFDLRDHRGGLNSVKTSVRNPTSGGDPYSTYLRGMADMLGVNSGKYEQTSTSLFPELPTAEGTAMMMRDGYLSINDNHVEPFKAALKDPDNYTKRAYRQLADQLLNEAPARINGVAYRTYQALANLLQSSGISATVRQQVEAALRNVREQLANRIRSNGLTSQHLIRLLNFRRQVGLANPQMSSEQFRTWLFPETLMAIRYGGGWQGNMTAAGIGAGRGAAGGAVIAMIVETTQLIYYQPPGMGQQLVNTGLAGGTAGLTGGAVETLAAGSLGSAMARQLTLRGTHPWVASGMGRGLGGAMGGAVAAPVFSMTMLALDDQEHTATDYAATGTRAAVSGTLSAALGAGVVGAIWGSEVPLAGNIVGFIIGFAGYYAVDALMGDDVEQGVRDALDR